MGWRWEPSFWWRAGRVIRLATGQYCFSPEVSRREKNWHHRATLMALTAALVVMWGLAHFAVVETRYAYAMAALVGGVLLLRAVFIELGVRHRGKGKRSGA